MDRAIDAAAADDGGETAGFECNICIGLAKEPVITLCGHLHCWPCLYEWLRFHSQSHECPVCKALIRDEELIPLLGRGDSSSHRRLSVPRRPAVAIIQAREGTGQFGLSAVRRVRFREFPGGNGYGSFGEGTQGNGEDEEGNINIDDNNMKKIIFLILVFVVFDFLII